MQVCKKLNETVETYINRLAYIRPIFAQKFSNDKNACKAMYVTTKQPTTALKTDVPCN